MRSGWAVLRAAALRGANGRPALWQQALIIGVGLYLYDALRHLAPTRRDLAFANAHRVLDLEGRLHLDPERWLNQVFAAHAALAVPANYFYNNAHFVVTLSVLAWLYWRHVPSYRPLRNVFALMTGIGFLGFWLFPLAPPRMLAGFVDTVAVHHTLGGYSASLAAHADELAAMPSLHVGWALWCAVVLVRLNRRWWVRGLAALFPVLTTVAIIGTANHYLLDVVAGAALVGLAFAAEAGRVRLVAGRRSRPPSAWRAGKWSQLDDVAVGDSVFGERAIGRDLGPVGVQHTAGPRARGQLRDDAGKQLGEWPVGRDYEVGAASGAFDADQDDAHGRLRDRSPVKSAAVGPADSPLSR